MKKSVGHLFYLVYLKFSFAVIVLAVFSTFSRAAVKIPEGNVSGTWTQASSPYLIEGDITVSSGEMLVIEAGVVVEFQDWFRLIVNGTLQAVGTPGQQIVFTATPPGPGEPGWPGIDFINASGSSILEYCVVENGKSIAATPNDRGGAIYILNSSPTIKYCTLRDNLVKSYGSAIYIDNGNPLIEACTITDNSVGYGTQTTAGTIYSTNYSQPQIIGNNISHNSVGAYGGYSPANASAGGIYLHHSDAIIHDNVISYNTVHSEGNVPSHARGGAVYIYFSNPVLTGNTVYGNETSVYSSPGEGGGLYIYGGNPILVNNILWNDSPKEIFFSESGTSSVLVAYSDVKGGQYSITSSNYSTTYWQEGNTSSDPKFTDAAQDDFTLQSNSPVIDAGTAHYDWQSAVIVDIDASQYSGDAPDMGALEYGESGGVNQAPVAIASATPDHGNSPLYVEFSSEGSYDPDGTIVSYFWDFGDGSTSTEQNPSHTFEGVDKYGVTLTVTDDQNTSNTKSIVINVQDGTTLTDGEVSGNWTLQGSPYRIEGDLVIPYGAILSIAPGVRVESQGWYRILVQGQIRAVGTESAPVLFTSTPPGPGEPGWLGLDFVDAEDGSILQNCVIENCQARAAEPNDRGGAIYLVNSNPEIRSCVLQNNKVIKYGGAIYCDGSNPLIEGCNITNNSAGSYAYAGGGAIYCTNNSTPRISNNLISHNNTGASGGFGPATGTGGAIHLSESDATIENNVISFNSVGVSGNVPFYARGGAVYISNSSPVLVGNTIYGNDVKANGQDSQGDGLFVLNSTVLTVNNILWNNSPQEAFVASSYNPSTVVFAFSDVEGGGNGIDIENDALVYWQEGNINNDPLFADAENNDFSLMSSSPCIDAGTAYYEWQVNVLIDLDASQYNGSAPDMGAIESEFTVRVNQPPVAVAAASPVSGEAPLTVQFNSDASYDPDGTIVSYLWSSGGTSVPDPNPSYTFNNPGLYDITLEVTDDDGTTDTDVISVEVQPATVNELHVAYQLIYRTKDKGRWYGVDEVRVFDQDNQPMANAVVTANYSGPTSGTVNGTTGSDGIVLLYSDEVKKPNGDWCFEVTDISKNNTVYNPDANVVTIQCEQSTASRGNFKTAEINTSSVKSLKTRIYPNPFRNETIVDFELAKSQPVSMKIYDSTGKLIRVLLNDIILEKGIHSYRWNGLAQNGQKITDGIYYIRLTKNNVPESFRVLHAK